MFKIMGRKRTQETEISEVSSTSSSSTPTMNKNENINKDEDNVPQNEILFQNYVYKDLLIKSVFNYKDFKLNTSNFEDWFIELKRHLIAQDYDEYIEKEFVYDDMTRKQIKYDNAVQSIISGSLDLETKAYLKGCRTAYQMIDRLKKQFYKSGESLLNLLMQKIKILEINNNNYILYLNELKNLFEQYDIECVKLNKNKLTEESKIIDACAKLKNIGFNFTLTYKYKKFNEFHDDLQKMRNHEERINNYLNTQINNNNENNNENNKIHYISNSSKQTIYKNNNNQNKPNNSRNRNNKKIKIKHCLLCKKDGHI